MSGGHRGLQGQETILLSVAMVDTSHYAFSKLRNSQHKEGSFMPTMAMMMYQYRLTDANKCATLDGDISSIGDCVLGESEQGT